MDVSFYYSIVTLMLRKHRFLSKTSTLKILCATPKASFCKYFTSSNPPSQSKTGPKLVQNKYTQLPVPRPRIKVSFNKYSLTESTAPIMTLMREDCFYLSAKATLTLSFKMGSLNKTEAEKQGWSFKHKLQV